MSENKGIKYDTGKAPLSLVPIELLEATAQALAYGANKYGKNNYKGGMSHSRILDALLRHVYAYASKEDNDKESGLNHIAHAAANCAMLLYYIKHKPELDDR